MSVISPMRALAAAATAATALTVTPAQAGLITLTVNATAQQPYNIFTSNPGVLTSLNAGDAVTMVWNIDTSANTDLNADPQVGTFNAVTSVSFVAPNFTVAFGSGVLEQYINGTTNGFSLSTSGVGTISGTPGGALNNLSMYINFEDGLDLNAILSDPNTLMSAFGSASNADTVDTQALLFGPRAIESLEYKDVSYRFENAPVGNVPEPGTLLLVGASLLALAARRRDAAATPAPQAA